MSNSNDVLSLWRAPLLALSDERLLEIRMLPGTDLDDYLQSVITYDILVERGYSEEALMNMVNNVKP